VGVGERKEIGNIDVRENESKERNDIVEENGNGNKKHKGGEDGEGGGNEMQKSGLDVGKKKFYGEEKAAEEAISLSASSVLSPTHPLSTYFFAPLSELDVEWYIRVLQVLHRLLVSTVAESPTFSLAPVPVFSLVRVCTWTYSSRVLGGSLSSEPSSPLCSSSRGSPCISLLHLLVQLTRDYCFPMLLHSVPRLPQSIVLDIVGTHFYGMHKRLKTQQGRMEGEMQTSEEGNRPKEVSEMDGPKLACEEESCDDRGERNEFLLVTKEALRKEFMNVWEMKCSDERKLDFLENDFFMFDNDADELGCDNLHLPSKTRKAFSLTRPMVWPRTLFCEPSRRRLEKSAVCVNCCCIWSWIWQMGFEGCGRRRNAGKEGCAEDAEERWREGRCWLV
jgi:hypothetical protein